MCYLSGETAQRHHETWRIFNSASISYLIFSYLFLIFAMLCKFVIRMFVLSPILILEMLQLCPKILTITLCSFQYSNWMQMKNIIGWLWIYHLTIPAPSILNYLNPLQFKAIASSIHISELSLVYFNLISAVEFFLYFKMENIVIGH